MCAVSMLIDEHPRSREDLGCIKSIGSSIKRRFIQGGSAEESQLRMCLSIAPLAPLPRAPHHVRLCRLPPVPRARRYGPRPPRGQPRRPRRQGTRLARAASPSRSYRFVSNAIRVTSEWTSGLHVTRLDLPTPLHPAGPGVHQSHTRIPHTKASQTSNGHDIRTRA